MIKRVSDLNYEPKTEKTIKSMPAKRIKTKPSQTESTAPVKEESDAVTRREFEECRQELIDMMNSLSESGTPPKKIGRSQGKEIKSCRDKWMATSTTEKPVLYDLFGSGYFRIWDLVRTLSIAVSGNGKALHLSEEDDIFIANLMDDICLVLEKHRKEYIEAGKAKNVGRKYADKVKIGPINQLPVRQRETFDETTYHPIEALSDEAFKTFFMKWAIQHHIMVYPDQKRDTMMGLFKDYYRINPGDIKRVLASLEVKQDV